MTLYTFKFSYTPFLALLVCQEQVENQELLLFLLLLLLLFYFFKLVYYGLATIKLFSHIDYFHQSLYFRFMYNDRGSEKPFSVKYIKPVGD